MDSLEAPTAPSPYIAFTHPDYVLFQGARFASTLGIQMQHVAVGWQVYEITGRPLDLGLVGLAQFVPNVLLAPVAGDLVDRWDRRRILLGCHLAFALCALALALIARAKPASPMLVYAIVAVFGLIRSFAGPCNQAYLPDLVPAAHFPNAVTWSETIWQGAAVAGPALGGLLYGVTHGASTVYLVTVALSVLAFALLTRVRTRPAAHAHSSEESPTQRLMAGVRYVFARKVILGAISLDMFAVLLGGAVALLPVYARDVLHVGPLGLGLLRSATSFGAAATALVLAYRPLTRRAGPTMLACVGIFGAATIVFGLSRSFVLSLAMLALAGSVDMISVVVRHTVVQLATPASMRGRVSSVNSVFIGASNQLGEFESGAVAAWLGTVPAVIVGGIGTCVVVALWTWLFPELRGVDRLDKVGDS